MNEKSITPEMRDGRIFKAKVINISQFRHGNPAEDVRYQADRNKFIALKKDGSFEDISSDSVIVPIFDDADGNNE